MSFVIGLYHPPHEGRSLPSPLIYLGLVTCFGQENGAHADVVWNGLPTKGLGNLTASILTSLEFCW